MHSWTRSASRRWLAAMPVAVAVAALAGCGSSGSDDSSSSSSSSSGGGAKTVDGMAGRLAVYDGDGKVGFSIYNGSVPHWNQHDIPALKECLATYAPNVEAVTQDAKGSAQSQTSQVQSMLSQGIRVLLLVPASSSPTAILQATKQAQVPVINYASPILGAKEGEVAALVGDGPEPIGTAQAQWILDQRYPKGTEIALINGDLAQQYAQLMRRAQLRVLRPAIDAGDLVVVGDKSSTNWDGAEAEKQASAVLTGHPDVRAIIAGADFLAAGVINALRTEGKDGKVDIIGLDADPIGAQNMLLGTQKATILKSSDREMAIGCAGVIALLKGDPIPREVFSDTWDLGTAPMPFKDTPVKAIERDGLQEALDWRILTREQMCRGLPAGVGRPCT